MQVDVFVVRDSGRSLDQLGFPIRLAADLEPFLPILAAYNVLISTALDELPWIANQTRYYLPLERELYVQPSCYQLSLIDVFRRHQYARILGACAFASVASLVWVAAVSARYRSMAGGQARGTLRRTSIITMTCTAWHCSLLPCTGSDRYS